MEYDKIKQLMEEMDKSALSELEVEFPEGLKITMKKENNKDIVKNQELNLKEKVKENNAINISNKGNVVKSPMVGTFYLKPSPTEKQYVKIGDKVKKGDTLCIIEAMKLMNEIESEFTGTIKEVLVEDGAAVEYGTELFVIE